MVQRSDSAVGLPCNIEAEQALLGVLMYDNAVLHVIAGKVRATQFYEPAHQRLFQAIERRILAGQGADPLTLSNIFASDPAFEELGGVRYLADLIDRAPPAQNAPGWAGAVAEAHARRSIIQLAKSATDAAWNGAAPLPEILEEMLKELGDLTAGSDELRFVGPSEAIAEMFDRLDNPGAHGAGTLTGLGPLDGHLGEMLDGDLIVLGGRTGMGKSALSTCIGTNVAKAGGGVLEFNGEMSVQQVWRRRIAAEAFAIFADEAPGYSSIRKRTVTFDQRQMMDAAARALQDIPLKALKRTGLTLGRLRSLALRERAVFERAGIPLRLVIIDHVGLLKTDREHRSRVDQQTEISNGLKELAGDLGCPVLALAQLNRSTDSRDNKRPTLPDLRDSGSWEQDADVVIGLYREAYYAQWEKEPSTGKGAALELERDEWERRRKSKKIEAILLKVREGDTNTIDLWGNMATNTILGEAPDDSHGGFI